MNKFKKVSALTTALLMTAFTVNPSVFAEQGTADSYEMGVTVNVGDKGKAISPYIYGINEHGLDKSLKVKSVRQGGNRYSAYNWETNYSSAGSDWHHSSDDYLSKSSEPADCIQTLSKEATKGDIDYKLGTVQMTGYVAADKDGEVSEEESAPGKRWNEVVASKGSELSLTPDLTDGKVYIDEYVNYVVNMIGDSSTETGIQGWSLDNEPGLWHHTHSRIHKDLVTADELLQKSIDTAKAVKSVDPKAEIFGPALFGYTAFVQLSADDVGADWKNINADGKYDWFISYYLEQMKKAEEESGQRLLDVLDVHYYSEAKCPDCDTRMCLSTSHPADHEKGVDELTQAYRTLIEKDYKENSWIGEWCQQNIPLLTKMKESIDKYYPGTKLAVTEYDFGGGNSIAGAIAEVDALGTFANNDVYYATLWADDVPYQYSAINLFTNYDGEGSEFGNTLIESKTDDYIKSTCYASLQDGDQGEVNVIITNKDQKKSENAVIDLKGADTEYKNAAVYILSGETEEIIHTYSFDEIKDNKLTVNIPPLAIAEVVVSDDVNAYKPVVEVVKPTYEYIDGTVTKGKKDGDYAISFPEALDGNKLVLDIALDGTQSASGCVDFSVKYQGDDYWAHCGWAATTSGKVEVDLMNLTGAMNITAGDEESSTDEVLLAALAEEIKKMKTVSFQTWYVADADWNDTDHSKVTLKGAQIKKQTNSVPEPETFEGKVTADTKAGNYTVKFDEKLDGGKIILDIDVQDTALANGCLDTNVEIDGKPYWVHYSWEAKKSGKVEVDLMEPAGALDTSVEDGVDSTDEELLATVAEIIRNKDSLTFQTWYVADENWDDSDHGKVTLKNATLVKEAKDPVVTDPIVTTTTTEEPEVTTTTTKEPGITVTTVEEKNRLAGDVDGSGVVDLTDLSVLSLYILRETELDDISIKASDVTHDGKVDITDLMRIKQYVSNVKGVELN